MFVAGPAWVEGGFVKHDRNHTLLGFVTRRAIFLAGNNMIPIGYEYKGKGTHKMEFHTSELNQLKYPDAVSIHVAPTLMQNELSQTQAHVDLGISLNIEF